MQFLPPPGGTNLNKPILKSSNVRGVSGGNVEASSRSTHNMLFHHFALFLLWS